MGAMASPRGKAAFDRGAVVVQSTANPSDFLQVRAYEASDDIEGKPLTGEEWATLVHSEQAVELPPTDATQGAALWLLRTGFDGREAALEELRTSGVLLHDTYRLTDQSFACLVREPAANDLRDRWAERATEDALSWARSGNWERAREAASRAFVVERAMTPRRIALLTLTHEQGGNCTRAAGYAEMARHSRGEDFAAQVDEQLERFRHVQKRGGGAC